MNIVIAGGDYMNSSKELKWHELKRLYQPSDFSFLTTDEVKPCETVIGQENAMQMIQKALQIEAKGFNLYICGADSEEKERAIKEELQKVAKQKSIPLAMGYVHNFSNPEEPCLIELKAEVAWQLKDDIQEMIAFIIEELPKKLKTPETEKKREILVDAFEKYKSEQMMALNELADSHYMLVKTTNEGIYFTPKDEEGKPISKSEYSNLSIEEKEQIQAKLEKLYEAAESINKNIEEEEEKYLQLFKDINQEIVLQEIGRLIKYLQERYGDTPKLISYFNGIAEDLLGHLELISGTEDEEKDSLKEMFPWLGGNGIDKLTKKYVFNLIVSQENINGAPVIVDDEWPHLNLTGRLLFDTELNTVHSDFSQIRAGLLHYANGGYLVLHMQRLVENPNMWISLKRALKTEKIRVEGNEELNIALSNPIRPEATWANVKVVLLGSEELYHMLYEADDDFKKLFKVHAYFESELSSDIETIKKLAGAISYVCRKEHLPKVTIEGILKLVEYGNRQQETITKLPSDIDSLVDILREATLYAQESIDDKCIQMALKSHNNYSLKIQEKIDEQFKDESYLITTEGERIGQVNGLAVYHVLKYSFGRPIKITVTTYRGKQGIVDIEKQAELSGAIHTKGIHIITGFLGYEFAQDIPLSLSCNICFEQSYGQIDGDSASSAELYGVLSSLAELPIKQSLATTGSINQFGEIQPIGGVNEKIEGFFKVCQQRGLKGNEGVIIPKQNIKDLLLREEIIEAIHKGEFHIYPISNVWEGMELMTNKEKQEIIILVKNKLKKFNDK